MYVFIQKRRMLPYFDTSIIIDKYCCHYCPPVTCPLLQNLAFLPLPRLAPSLLLLDCKNIWLWFVYFKSK